MYKKFQLVAKLFGDREFLPHRGFINIFRKIVCEREPVGEAICENVVFLIAGFDKEQLNNVFFGIFKYIQMSSLMLSILNNHNSIF